MRDTSGRLYIINSGLLADSRWHDLEAVYDRSTGSIRLCQDSILIAQMSAPGELLVTSEPISIGARKDRDGKFSYLFTGLISNVAIYNRALY